MATAQAAIVTREPINNQMTAQHLAYQLQTSQMLRMLSRIFPGQTWTPTWLHDNVRPSYSFRNGIAISYGGQPFGSGTQHLWEIKISNSQWIETVSKAHKDISSSSLAATGLEPRRDGTYEWNSLKFRSPAEIEVAKVLESRGVLFFSNARCRIHDRLGTPETKETDFLVFYQGKARILEVDGKNYHQPEKDYRRDRLFDREGLRTTRFTASECLNSPEAVVEEFLELF